MRRSDSPEYRQALVEEMALQDIKKRMGNKITLNPKRDRFGYGTDEKKPSILKRLWRGEQIPFPGMEKFYNSLFTEDEKNYESLKKKLGKDIMEKHQVLFQQKYVSENPDLTLSDFNEYVLAWMKDVENNQ